MGLRKVAVVGAGMTKFVRRALETGKELAYEATKMALDSCELTLDDVDGVALGTAPEAFDGVHMKGEYLSDGAGAWRKPFMRCGRWDWGFRPYSGLVSRGLGSL